MLSILFFIPWENSTVKGLNTGRGVPLGLTRVFGERMCLTKVVDRIVRMSGSFSPFRFL